MGVEKESKKLSMKSVAAAKHRSDRYIVAHKQRNEFFENVKVTNVIHNASKPISVVYPTQL